MSSTEERSAVLATLHECEQRVKASEGQSVVARWEFGRAVLRLRQGKQLPKGMLAEIANEHQISRAEVGHRMRFAEACPTEAEVANTLETHQSWRRIIAEALPKKPRTAARQKPEHVSPHVLEARRLAAQLAKVDPASLTEADRSAYQKLYDELGDLLGLSQ